MACAGQLRYAEPVVARGEPPAVLVIGGNGQGKTVLLKELRRRAHAAGRSTVWLSAVGSINQQPLGALSPLVDDRTDIESWVQLRQAIVERLVAPTRPALVLLDDGHLADPMSTALLHQLVVARRILLATSLAVDSAEPEPLVALWKDGHGRRVTLGPLDEGTVGALLEQVLGGPVDRDTVLALHCAAGGNVRFLRDMVEASLARGRLCSTFGYWQLTGPAVCGEAAEALAHHQVCGAGSEVAALVEALSVLHPMPMRCLERLAFPARAVVEAERRGLVITRLRGDDVHVDLATAAHGRAMLASMTLLRRRELGRRLWSALHATSDVDMDPVRLAILMTQLDIVQDCDLLLDAAARAAGRFDDPTAARLYRSAIRAGAEPADTVAYAETLGRLGLWRSAERHRGWLSSAGRGRPPTAAVAMRGNVVHAERNSGAETDAEAGLPGSTDDVAPCTEAVARLVDTLTGSGQVRRALQVAASVRPADGRIPHELHAEDAVHLARCVALLFNGQIRAAEDLAAERYQHWARRRVSAARARWSWARGRAHLLRGQLDEAEEAMTEAAGLLAREPSGRGPVPLSRYLVDLAVTRAMCGDPAPEVLTRLDRVRPVVPDAAMAHAWTAAARGNIAGALDAGNRAVAECSRAGAFGLAILCRMDTVRIAMERVGHPAARTVVGQADGVLLHAAADYCASVASHDPAGLQAAAGALAAAGASLVAREAQEWAAAWFLRANRRSEAASARREVQLWSLGQLPARVPTARPSQPPVQLTAREDTIARHAVNGMRNSEIATALGISVRTVENHLQSAYTKLCISNRIQLVGALSVAPDGAGQP